MKEIYTVCMYWRHFKITLAYFKTTLSFVAFTDDERLMGDAAKNQAASKPSNTIFGNSLLYLYYLYSNCHYFIAMLSEQMKDQK